MKKLRCFLLTIALLLMASVAVSAAEVDHPDIPAVPGAINLEPESVIPEPVGTGEDNRESDDPLLGYLEQLGKKPVRKLMKAASAPTIGAAGRRLTGYNQKVYLAMNAQIAEVAAGRRGNTEITIPFSELNDGRDYLTAADLGGNPIIMNNDWNQAALNVFQQNYLFNLQAIVDALLADNPYNLYWYDKTSATGGSYFTASPPYSARYLDSEGAYVLYVNGGPTIRFPVAKEYAVDQIAGTYNFDLDIAASLTNIASNAASIVSRNASKNDYDKLMAYCTEICSMVSYNREAATTTPYPYGNPWQLIWVFDEDSTTNVVCEGYSKAFQYLCGLSTFVKDIECISVTGRLITSTTNGGHMWNIVSVDGKNYLVDVTNCDSGTIGAPYQLFMRGTEGSVSNGYYFQCNIGRAGYTYDSRMVTALGEEALTIEATDYYYLPLTGISLNTSQVNLTCAAAQNLQVTFVPADATDKTLTWSSDDTNVVTVSESGGLCAVKPGTATVKVVSRDGGFEQSCTVTVTHNVITIPGWEASCEDWGRTEESFCLGCGEVLTEPRDLTPLGHTGGTATCTAKAVCTRCHEEYGEVDYSNHVGETELRNATEASCATEGYTGDIYCLSCGKVVQNGEIIEKKPHTVIVDPAVAPTCTRNGLTEGSHCDVCHATLQAQAIVKALGHTGGTATCTAKAVCTRCSEEYGEVDPANHVGETELRNATEATCTSAGYTGDVYCLSCGNRVTKGEQISKKPHKMIIDPAVPATCTENGLTAGVHCDVCHTVLVAQKLVEATGHSGGTATCIAKAVCEVCHQEYGELDSNHHVGLAEIRNALDPTCTNAGYTGDLYCTSCGEKMQDGQIIAKKGHSMCHDPAIPATCTEEGLSEGSYCETCHEVFEEQKIIPATGHQYISAIDGKEKIWLCTVCGYSYTEILPADGIEYKENVIAEKKTDSDVSGAVFGSVCARVSTAATTSISIKWNGVSGATAYKVYAAKCNAGGKTYQLKRVKTTGASTRSYKYTGLKKGTYYKFLVMAVKGTKVLSISKTIHIATTGGKYTNAKALTLNMKSVSVKKGKYSKAVKVTKTNRYNSKRKLAAHRTVKYETSNKKIATVSAKGVVKGIKKGSCYLYIYAQDGVYRKIKITVK